MTARPFRPGVLLATFALAGERLRRRRRATPPASAATPAPSAPAPSRRRARDAGPATVPPGGPVEIRWYCCLGGGEAPEQKTVEDKVVADFNASHPNIHADPSRSSPYDQRATASSRPRSQSGNGPDIVGPVGIGGANAFHGQWLDLAPLIAKNELRPVRLPEPTSSTSTSSTRARSASRSRSTRRPSSTRRACSRRPASTSRRTSTASSTQMPDGSMVDWNYDTVRKIAQAADRRQERQGRHPGRRSTRRRSPSGASSRSATTCAAWAPTSARAASSPATARPSRSRTPGRQPGSTTTTASGPTTSA